MKKYKNTLIIILFSILSTIFICYPYLNKLSIDAQDLEFHLARIQQIALELSRFNVPVLIHSGLVDGLGYANSLFYPEVFLYIPALIHNMGIGTIFSYKIFILIITWFTFMSMFICTKRITKSNTISIISTMLYTFSLYRIVDIFTRAAIGEVLSFVFLPLIILGCYEILVGDKKKWWLVTIGIFGVANSHIISFAFSIGIIVFLIIFNIKNIIKEKDRIKYIIIAGITSILVVINIFLPMLEQVKENDYRVFSNKTSEELSTKALIPTQVLLNEYQDAKAKVENDQINEQMNFGIGILLIVLPLFIFITKFEDKKEKNIIIQLFVLGLLSLIATTQLFPWGSFKFLNVIQVPWRLNIISTLCFSIVSAYTAFYAMKKNKEIMYILAIIIICITSNYLGNVKYFDSRQIETNYKSIGQAEYLPTCMENIEPKKEDIAVYDIDNRDNVYDYKKEYNEISFEIINEKNSKNINIPLVYYKGYVANIDNNNNISNNKQKLELNMNKNNGLIQLSNPKLLTGEVKISYKMTLIQKISYIISYLTLLSVIIYATILKIKEEKGK